MRPIFPMITNTPQKKTPTKKPSSVPPKNQSLPAVESKEKEGTPQPSRVKPNMIVSPSRRTLFERPHQERLQQQVKSPARRTLAFTAQEPPEKKPALHVPAAHRQLMNQPQSSTAFNNRPSIAKPMSIAPPQTGRMSVAAPMLGRMSVQAPMIGRMSVVPTIGRMSVFTTGPKSVASYGRVSAMPPAGANAKPMPQIPKRTCNVPDNRPLDKSAMAKKIFLYLESQPEVPFKITEKKIRDDVITNDFTNIFSFLYRRIDRDFQMGKVDEHVPAIFAALGYQYPVQKKCFAPLGAANTWKLLLAALCWLIDLLESGITVSGAYESKQHEPSIAYSVSCYKELMEDNHVPDFAGVLDRYRQNTLKEEGLSNEQWNEMRARREANHHTLARLESETHEEAGETKSIVEEVEACEDEIRKHAAEVEEMGVQIEGAERMTQEQLEILSRLTVELSAISEANLQKEERIASQSVTGGQVRQMHAERQNFLGMIKCLRGSIEESEKRLYQIQPSAYDKQSDLRTSFKMFEIRLKELCNLLLGAEGVAKIDWSECAKHEDLTADAFISHEHGGLFDLIGKTKSGVEESIADMRTQQHELLLKAEEGSRQLTLSAEIKDQLEKEYRLKLEQMTRDVKDASHRDGDTVKELEVAKANHKRLREGLDEIMQRVKETRDEIAKTEKTYIAEKAEKARLFMEARLEWERRLHAHREAFIAHVTRKKELFELAERIVTENQKTIDMLRALERETGPTEEED